MKVDEDDGDEVATVTILGNPTAAGILDEVERMSEVIIFGSVLLL